MNLIVTKHKGLVEWLKLHGIEGEVRVHVNPGEIIGRDVVGILPYHLAALAKTVTVVDMVIPYEMRGIDISPAEMDVLGAKIAVYKVTEVKK